MRFSDWITPRRGASPRSLGRALLLLVAAGASPRVLAAQENYEIQVYPSAVIGKGRTMVELHSNYTFDGLATTDGSFSARHALHETIEITHGFSDWFELGVYLFSAKQPANGLDLIGFHVRPRFSVPESWTWPVGLSLSNEIGVAKAAYAPDRWSWEIRPIVDQKVGPVYWSANPVFGLALAGPNKGGGAVFAPSAKIAVDVNSVVALGFEYYGSVGKLGAFDPRRDEYHQIFPTVDLDLGASWEFNFGVGYGLTPGTDHLMTKLILGRRF